MSKKNSNISSLLKSDRAKRFKDTSFIWEGQAGGLPQKENASSSSSDSKENADDMSLLNLSQSEAKLEPNLSQSEVKLEPKKEKLEPNLSQSEVKLEPKKEKLRTQLEPKLEPNLSQNLGQSEAKLEPKIKPKNFILEKKAAKHIDHKSENIWKEFEARLTLKNTNPSFEYLTGLQRKIFALLFLELSRDRVTGFYRLNNMSKVIGGTESSIRKAIQRLDGNGFVERYEYKNGRGGATSYYLRENICNEIEKRYSKIQLQQMLSNNQNYEIKLEPNLSQSEAKLGTQPRTELRPSCSSSSSSLILNKKTTTTSGLDEWASIKIPDVLRLHNFGEHIVKQIRDRELLKPFELQDSLDAYAFDISENDLIKSKKIGDPVRYFMSVANKKMQYAPSSNYASDETKALEENKRRFEMLKQRREETEQINAELAFEEWLASLSEEKKLELAPEDLLVKAGHPFHTQLLRAHYDRMIYGDLSFPGTSHSSQ